MLNKISGLDIDLQQGIVNCSAGVAWDEIVDKVTKAGMFGVEAMSYIPGTCGASPINNIGAYGQELKDTLVNVRAYNIKDNKFIEFSNQECNFGYRESRFKSRDWGKYIIVGITLKLHKLENDTYKLPQYQSVIEQLQKDHIEKPGPSDVRNVLKIIRFSKLPNPKTMPNAGSFFKNPVVEKKHATKLKTIYPTLPVYPYDNNKVKLAAGWLIENAGLRNYRQNGIWVYEKQALVLVNESAESYKDLELMSKYIIDAVNSKYSIILELEPEIV
jgi:UDP-N-acetylmuramate dehydrogenase